MTTECSVRIRVDEETKTKANKLFHRMGLNMSEAVRLFLHQVVADKGIPFRINTPNATTIEALQEIKSNAASLKKTTIEQLAKDWNKARA